MDFFEAQTRARKRTTRLVALFLLAVAGTILASYFAAVVGVGLAREQQRARQPGYDDDETSAFSPWQPALFAGVSAGVLLVVGLASLAKWGQFSAGGGAVAASVGGRRVDPHSTDLRERRLLNVVEEMAIASGTPVPAVYVLDDEPAINAFAAGLTTSDAIVAVTRGTLEKLNRDELQGVVGHEFSHILNGDMRLNVRITALLFGILVLGLAGRGILWSLRGARLGSRGKNSGGIVVAILFIGLALLIIGYAGYFFGRLIQAAVSRQREFLADASAIQFTRNPVGLSGALKKIGGYEIGSSLETSKAAAIGHFFFAQSFRSGITGWWSTHPALPERIRAIDPQWDGQMFTPPTVVDVAKESFASAGLAPAAAPATHVPLPAFAAAAAVASAGTVGPQQIAAAGALLGSVAPALRDATRSTVTAPALVYGLVLDDDVTVRTRQRGIVAGRDGPARIAALEALDVPLQTVTTEQKLPLVQLAIPALRQLPGDDLKAFLATLDELVRADERISTFEFALQKLLARSLGLARNPASAVVNVYSFNAVVSEIAVVLSALAHVSSTDPAAATNAFAAGAAQIKLISDRLTYVPAEACAMPVLDAALDKLATASGPIKQRTLLAAAYVVSADGQVTTCEAELLRAVAAVLDVPMPAAIVA